MKTYRNKYNEKYGNKKNKSNSLKEISKKTGVSMKGLQAIYNKGIGAFKTNPQSVRPNMTKEQWAMGRVYSSVMGGKASKIDKKELKMEKGGEVCTYDYVGYEVNARQCENEGVDYLLTGEYIMVARSLYKTNYNLWLYYNYINRLQITLEDCKEFSNQLKKEFTKLPLPISVLKAVGKRKRSYGAYRLSKSLADAHRKENINPNMKINTQNAKGGYITINGRELYCQVWTEMVCCDESWGAYFLDKNTNRPIPALDRKDYYSLTTLIHELAHCLDFQYQMLDTGKPPVIAHKDYFLKALYKILTACKDGKIKLARSIDLRANLLQKYLNTSEGRKKYYTEPLSKIRLRNMQS
jgi:hypothetical protein